MTKLYWNHLSDTGVIVSKEPSGAQIQVEVTGKEMRTHSEYSPVGEHPDYDKILMEHPNAARLEPYKSEAQRAEEMANKLFETDPRIKAIIGVVSEGRPGYKFDYERAKTVETRIWAECESRSREMLGR